MRTPGAGSRFSRTIEFERYSPVELLQVFTDQAHGQEFTVADTAAEPSPPSSMPSRSAFPTAMAARSALEASVTRQSIRIEHIAATGTTLDRDTLSRLEAEDIG